MFQVSIKGAGGVPVDRRVAVNDPFRSEMTLISLRSEINGNNIQRQDVRDHMDNLECETVAYTKLVPGRMSAKAMQEIMQSLNESPMNESPKWRRSGTEGSRSATCGGLQRKRKLFTNPTSTIMRLVLVSLT